MIGNSRSACGKRSSLGEFVLSEISEGGEKHHYSFSPPKEEGKKSSTLTFTPFFSLYSQIENTGGKKRERERDIGKKEKGGESLKKLFFSSLPPISPDFPSSLLFISRYGGKGFSFFPGDIFPSYGVAASPGWDF